MTTTLTKPSADCFTEAFATLQSELPRGVTPYVQDLRQQGQECFKALGFPTLKMEEWRFTNVGPIAKTAFEIPSAPSRIQASDLELFDIEG